MKGSLASHALQARFQVCGSVEEYGLVTGNRDVTCQLGQGT